MKETKIIRDSVSPFNFPLVVVKKKKDADGNQKLRVCVNFRELNEIIRNKLEEVFVRLRSHKLKFQPSKCAFLRKQVLYLGHVINENGFTPDPNKLKCIKDYPRQKTEKEIKSFPGLLNYYRIFVDNFAKVAKPLNNLLKKDVPFKWCDQCEHALDELKKALMNPLF